MTRVDLLREIARAGCPSHDGSDDDGPCTECYEAAVQLFHAMPYEKLLRFAALFKSDVMKLPRPDEAQRGGDRGGI